MRISKWFLLGFIVFSSLGFLDATFLTVQHYNQDVLPCYIFQGCDKVTASKYSEISNVPVSLFGSAYYLFIFLVSIFYADTKNEKALRILFFFPIAGFAASLWFLFLQLFVIKAICLYCVISIVSSTALFILGLWALKLCKEKK